MNTNQTKLISENYDKHTWGWETAQRVNALAAKADVESDPGDLCGRMREFTLFSELHTHIYTHI